MLSKQILRSALLSLGALIAASGCGSDETSSFSSSGATSTSSAGGATSSASAASGAGGATTATGVGGASATSGSTGAGGAGGATSGAGGAGGFDPLQDPTATINHPGDGQMRPVGVPITFAGQATDPQDGMLMGASLVWTDDLEGPLGTGQTFNKALNMVGMHTITLTATDVDGNTGTDSISQILVAP